jgi:hypothetical protein
MLQCIYVQEYCFPQKQFIKGIAKFNGKKYILLKLHNFILSQQILTYRYQK